VILEHVRSSTLFRMVGLAPPPIVYRKVYKTLLSALSLRLNQITNINYVILEHATDSDHEHIHYVILEHVRSRTHKLCDLRIRQNTNT